MVVYSFAFLPKATDAIYGRSSDSSRVKRLPISDLKKDSGSCVYLVTKFTATGIVRGLHLIPFSSDFFQNHIC